MPSERECHGGDARAQDLGGEIFQCRGHLPAARRWPLYSGARRAVVGVRNDIAARRHHGCAMHASDVPPARIPGQEAASGLREGTGAEAPAPTPNRLRAAETAPN